MWCHVTVWIDPRWNHIRAVLFRSLSFVTVQHTGWTSQEYLMAGKQCWQEHMVSSALVNGSPCMCMRHAAIMGNCPVCHMVQVTTFPASVCTLIFIVVVATSTRITDLSNPSSCDAWVGCPTYYDSTKAALASMEKTYHVNYLQVFNMHGRLIQPSEYYKVLQGAPVQMHFTMTHWYIRPKGQWHASDVFDANIYSMWVLTPPKATGPVTPRKRKFVNMDPIMPDISPEKFRKTPSPWSRLLFFALMKQYLYDVQVKAAQPSFTSVSPKCPQNPSSACDFYTVFYVQHISTYCQTNYHIPFI